MIARSQDEDPDVHPHIVYFHHSKITHPTTPGIGR